jgi:60 kDa SS-A/Ro ribonucleoprotein
VKLRGVLFLCHTKPKDAEQAAVWRMLVENTLKPLHTWEVALSAGKDKRENLERLLREGKLGGLAVLRNLRLMLASGVDPQLIRERLDTGVARALPFRFVTAARHAPKLEDERISLMGRSRIASVTVSNHERKTCGKGMPVTSLRSVRTSTQGTRCSTSSL